MVDSVSVRWVDLGTRLILRHVVRVVGAEDNNSSNDDNEDETDGDGENSRSKHQNVGPAFRRQRQKKNARGKTNAAEKSIGNVVRKEKKLGGNTERAMPTTEVDLSEVRWAESVESDELQSSSLGRQMVGEL